MITRMWRGWTTPANASLFQQLLLCELFPSVVARNPTGYRGISLVRRAIGDEVEFVILMWFDSLDAVRAFAGEDYEMARVPPSARAILKRFDPISAHYETVVEPVLS